MSFPFFYITGYDPAQPGITLDEDNSRHIIQVLRMKAGESLHLTDGKGNLLTALISEEHKKHCRVTVQKSVFQSAATRKIQVAISLIKNASRFEWFLEKATEIGVSEIIPLLCERTEKQKFRHDRMQGILVSAMLQSQQCWLPVLQEPIAVKKLISQSGQDQKFIAHCTETEKRKLADLVNSNLSSQIILVGPEGDFSREEIDFAITHHFTAVSLGETRLRTETAGLVAATILRQ